MQNVVLSPNELQKMHDESAAEIAARVGTPPTVSTLRAAGEIEESRAAAWLDGIDNFGRVVTLLVAEIVQSVAALIIAAVFAVLEYQRVLHGAMALGQSVENSQWIAAAVVCANFIIPIYVLKALRGNEHRTVTRSTVKSAAAGLWQRVTGDAETVAVSWSYNPTLKASKTLITFTTILLAVYDLLAPILVEIFDTAAAGAPTGEPMFILVIKLVIGFGLSVAGVFFLQSAAHEIGVRMLADRPAPAADVLKAARADYDRRAADIRAEIRDKYESAKRDQLNAKRAARAADQTTSATATDQRPAQPVTGANFTNGVKAAPTMNGNGKH